jgi:Bacterial signalling protein N terminal repeat
MAAAGAAVGPTRWVTELEFILSGIFMGIGIVSMHYTGMAAMRMPADIRVSATTTRDQADEGDSVRLHPPSIAHGGFLISDINPARGALLLASERGRARQVLLHE